MLLIKNKIGPSKIHGTGLFADEFIPKGAPVWKFSKGLDRKFTEEEMEKLDKRERDYILFYCYHSDVDETYVLCFDNARFFNHSDKPNVKSLELEDEPEGMEIASRDILTGEEIVCDCREFDIDCAGGKEEYVK